MNLNPKPKPLNPQTPNTSSSWAWRQRLVLRSLGTCLRACSCIPTSALGLLRPTKDVKQEGLTIRGAFSKIMAPFGLYCGTYYVRLPKWDPNFGNAPHGRTIFETREVRVLCKKQQLQQVSWIDVAQMSERYPPSLPPPSVVTALTRTK